MDDCEKLFGIKLSDKWPPEVAQLVGFISIAFAQLQREVYRAAKRKKGKGLIEWERENRSDNFSQWCRHLIAEYPKDKTLVSMVERAQCVGQKRNDLIHADWGRGPDGTLGRWRRHQNLGIELEPLEYLLCIIRELRDGISRYTLGVRATQRKTQPERD
jgi:hypothetical protein